MDYPGKLRRPRAPRANRPAAIARKVAFVPGAAVFVECHRRDFPE
jgi:hypothetical protein